MTKLEALIALRDKVKAGSDQWSAHTIYLALGGHYGKWFYRANHGSLDAAKALRVEVGLPVSEKMHSDARIELLEILEALIAKEQQ